MALRQTLPRAQWKPAHFYNLNKQNKAKRLSTVKRYPDGAILHWDANADTYDSNYLTELTGGPHTFNHAILSPQYQRNADGSYTDVGARPAVDVFDGEKWLRSCGAVTNLLPSGSEDLTASSWVKRGTAVVAAGNLVSGIGPGDVYIARAELTANTSLTPSIEIKRVSTTGVFSIVNPAGGELGGWNVDLSLLSDDYEKITSDHPSVSIGNAFVVSPSGVSGFHFVYQSGVSPLSFYVRNPQLTTTAYPVPYTPPDTTMPASNATTTNGCWFALPDGSPMWKALTGEPLTLATRVRMGVGSGDVLTNTYPQIFTCRGSGSVVVYYGDSGGNKFASMSWDGGNYPAKAGAWSRNAIMRLCTQVNTAGTQFRVGYMIEGTHTAIQWSSWVAFDGSFGPSTLYRLMLGYNNAYPMWFSRITAWKEQVSDDRILEALNG